MQVLVSVNSVAEAQLVLSAGVPLIDLKETSHGALAALDIDRSTAIIEAIFHHRQQTAATDIVISATVGDHCDTVDDLIQMITSRLQIGVEVIKLPEAIWAESLYQPTIAALLAQGLQLIAVMHPDSLMTASMQERLQALAQQGYWGVMVDTTHKSRALIDIVPIAALADFVQTAKSARLFVGIAGSLLLAHIEPLSKLAPDYLGFRSGLCEGTQRAQGLLAGRVHELIARVSEIC
jgi:(5-formylfuran-3-yl)methyl phosphate synthase